MVRRLISLFFSTDEMSIGTEFYRTLNRDDEVMPSTKHRYKERRKPACARRASHGDTTKSARKALDLYKTMQARG